MDSPLSRGCHALIRDGATLVRNADDVIESISLDIINELRREGLSQSSSDFLLQHAEEVQARIGDPQFREMHLMAE